MEAGGQRRKIWRGEEEAAERAQRFSARQARGRGATEKFSAENRRVGGRAERFAMEATGGGGSQKIFLWRMGDCPSWQKDFLHGSGLSLPAQKDFLRRGGVFSSSQKDLSRRERGRRSRSGNRWGEPAGEPKPLLFLKSPRRQPRPTGSEIGSAAASPHLKGGSLALPEARSLPPINYQPFTINFPPPLTHDAKLG